MVLFLAGPEDGAVPSLMLEYQKRAVAAPPSGLPAVLVFDAP